MKTPYFSAEQVRTMLMKKGRKQNISQLNDQSKSIRLMWDTLQTRQLH